jgi:proline iminopeptidase
VLCAGCDGVLPVSITSGDLAVSLRGSLHYTVVGAAPDTVIVLHGGPGLHSRYLRLAFDPLAARHTLIYYDQRGRGRSTADADSTTLTALQDVQDLDSLRRFFRLSRVTLVGHHWGAVLAALYAKRYPEHVARLLLVSPAYPSASYVFAAATLPHDTRAIEAYLRALTAHADSLDPATFCRQFWGFLFTPRELTDPALVHRLAGEMCDAPPVALRRGWAINRYVRRSLHGFNLRDTLRAVVAPTLVVQGATDTATAEGARAWVEWIPGAKKVDLSQPGPFPWLGDRARFDAVVRTFLGD